MIHGNRGRVCRTRRSLRGMPSRSPGAPLLLSVVLCAAVAFSGVGVAADIVSSVAPVPSVDPESFSQAYPDIKSWVPRASSDGLVPPPQVSPNAPPLLNVFESFNFDDNATYNGGFLFIPPDPIGACGPNHLVSIGNVLIEWRTKIGGPRTTQALQTFFNAQSYTFDPKVIYDQHAGRFVAMTLEQATAPNASRIYVAVSQTSDPNGGWYFLTINSALTFFNVNLGANASHWADYPGLAIDDGAIYITNNMFSFGSNTFGDSRLWIIDKGFGTGGFYDGGPASWNVYDPSVAPAPTEVFTLQPSHVFGPNPGSDAVFLTAAGWSNDFSLPVGDGSGSEFLLVIRADNPLTGPTFSHQFVNAGNIENSWNGMPNAQQAFCPIVFPNECNPPNIDVETNDRRSLHSVWRNNRLYVTAQLVPEIGPDAFQSTAHWWDVSTLNLAALALNDQGDVGAEDLGPQTHTFFPSIAVDSAGNIGLGFAASNEQIYPGAYYTGRLFTDPLGTVQPTGTLALGQDCYRRFFSGTRNRWGDYSGIGMDPTDDATFWVFNEYAIERGTPTSTPPGCDEYGRWSTRWGSFKFQTGTPDLIVTVFNGPCCAYHNQQIGNQMFCRVKNVGTATTGVPFSVGFYVSIDPIITTTDMLLINGQVTVGPLIAGQEIVVPIPASVTVPPAAPLGSVYLGAIADDLSNVPESDETNNTLFDDISIGQDVFWCTTADVSYAADPLQVSVFTSPNGSGNALNAAQQWNGIVGSPPAIVNATVTAVLTDDSGAAVPGVNLFLLTSQGGLVPCVNGNRSDNPTDASGTTTWSRPLFGGGYTDPGNGEVAQVFTQAGPFAQILYNPKQLWASDQFGNMYTVDHLTGLATPVCPMPPSSTEIEYNPDTGLAFVQQSNGAFMGQEFLINNCIPVAPPLFNGWAINGLEWMGPILYGMGVPASCAPSVLLILDPLTGATFPIGPTGDPRPMTGMAWDADCYTMYAVTGCFNQFGPADLYTVDLNTGWTTLVGNTQLQLGSLEFGPDGQLYAGGGQVDGGNLWIIDPNSGAATFVGPTGLSSVTGLALVSPPGLDIQFNSPDINGDLTVNLIDLGTFSADYVVGPYHYRCDFYWDGQLNLNDLARFAATVGEVCPVIPAKPPEEVAIGGEIGISFDGAGLERVRSLEPGTEAMAYVTVRGPVAERGITAWQSRVETSGNVEILEWILDASTLNITTAPEFMVGTGGAVRAAKGAALQLAALRFRVTDAEPAHFFLRSVEMPAGPASPAVASGDDLFALSVAGGSEDLPVAYVNDRPTDTSFTFAGVNMRAVPNPFNPSTEIRFSLPHTGSVELRIYDVGGRLVRHEAPGVLNAGDHAVTWNGVDQNGAPVGSGIYFVRLFLDRVAVGETLKTSLLK